MALRIFSFRKKKKTVFLLKNRQCSPVSPPSPVNVHGDSPTEPAPRGRPGLSHVHCCLSLLLAFSARLPPLPSALSTQQRGPVGMQVRSHSPTVQRVPPTRRRPTPVSQSRSLSAPPAGAGLPGLLLISAFTPTSLLNEQAEHGPTSGPLPCCFLCLDGSPLRYVHVPPLCSSGSLLRQHLNREALSGLLPPACTKDHTPSMPQGTDILMLGHPGPGRP